MEARNWMHQRAIRLLITAILALIGGFLFQWLQMPIPWLLGPMILVFLGARFFNAILPYWPTALRDSGIVIVGWSHLPTNCRALSLPL